MNSSLIDNTNNGGNGENGNNSNNSTDGNTTDVDGHISAAQLDFQITESYDSNLCEVHYYNKYLNCNKAIFSIEADYNEILYEDKKLVGSVDALTISSVVSSLPILVPYKQTKNIEIDGIIHNKFNFLCRTESCLWCNNDLNCNRTDFSILERHDINKNDFTFVTLLFPVYRNGKKIYEYLLSTCMVAYLLKNRKQSLLVPEMGTRANISCMVTPDVEDYVIDILSIYYDNVIVVPYISWNTSNLSDDIVNNPEKFIKIQDVSCGTIPNSHPYSHVMTKLNLFNKKIFNYKKVVFLDSDLYPMRYFDSLFSYNSPAGWLEHARIKLQDNPIYEWGSDRTRFMNNITGSLLPDVLTDLKLSQAASDVNASIYVFEPNNEEYHDIIRELTVDFASLFGLGKKYDGYYIGNRKRDNYGLPEQNYLTQRYSGKWHGICFGYESWLIDIDNALGIHFAAFRIKPWSVQVIGNKFTINKRSIFSKTHNQNTGNRTYGMKIFNELLYEFLNSTDNKLKIYFCKDLYHNLRFFGKPFDPWDPEIDLGSKENYLKLDELNVDSYKKMTVEQLKLSYFIIENYGVMEKKIPMNIITKKLVFDEYYKNLYDPLFLSICYLIMKDMMEIINKYNLTVNKHKQLQLFAEGGTLLGAARNNGFLGWDDDIDIGVLGESDIDGNEKMLVILELALTNGFFCYVHMRKDKNKMFLSENIITKRVILTELAGYYVSQNFVSLIDLKKDVDLANEMMFINVSLSQDMYVDILKNNGYDPVDDYYIHLRSSFLKIPWVDFLPYIAKTHNFKKYYKFRKGGSLRQMNPYFLGISESKLLPFTQKQFLDIKINLPKNYEHYAYLLWNDEYIWEGYSEPTLNANPTNKSPINKITIYNRHGDESNKKIQLLENLSLSDIKLIDREFNNEIDFHVKKIGSILYYLNNNAKFLKKFLY